MNRTTRMFKIYAVALLIGLAFYQRSYSVSGVIPPVLPSTEAQRSAAVGNKQPANWAFYARGEGEFRAEVTRTTNLLMAAPSAYVAFMAEKKRADIRETVAVFDAQLKNLEDSSVTAFDQTAQSDEEVVRRATAARQAAAAASMRRNATTSYGSSSSSYSSSSSSHK